MVTTNGLWAIGTPPSQWPPLTSFESATEVIIGNLYQVFAFVIVAEFSRVKMLKAAMLRIIIFYFKGSKNTVL